MKYFEKISGLESDVWRAKIEEEIGSKVPNTYWSKKVKTLETDLPRMREEAIKNKSWYITKKRATRKVEENVYDQIIREIMEKHPQIAQAYEIRKLIKRLEEVESELQNLRYKVEYGGY